MRIILTLILFFSFQSIAGQRVCTLTQNVDGIINSIADGNGARVADPTQPVMYRQAIDDVTDQRDVVDGLRLTQQRYEDYYRGLERGTTDVDIHMAVQLHLKEQLGEGYIRALKPAEVDEIMRLGQVQNGQFFSQATGGAHVGHNRSAIYIRCIRNCDQYFGPSSTGSGVQAIRPIPASDIEIIVPDYDAAFQAARRGGGAETMPGAASATPPASAVDEGAVIVEEIDDLNEFREFYLQAYGLNESQIKNARLDQFVNNGRQFNKHLGIFDFDKSTAQKLAGGLNNGGVIRVTTKNGDNMVVKVMKDRFGEALPTEEILQEIRNAQLVHKMGIGPETHLMRTNSGYNLVMKESPGVNIKEIINPKNVTDKTKGAIDRILGVQTSSVDEARRLYAQRILGDENLMAEMRRVGHVLDQHRVDSIDLQMMLSPGQAGAPASAQVIDTSMFGVGGALSSTENAAEVERMIRELRKVAGQ